MNKYQKIASQMAKDDIKKGYPVCDYRQIRNGYLEIARQDKFPLKKFIDFKKFNKRLNF